MKGQIFICYRRDDSWGWAERLYNRLSAEFPQSQIFVDADNFEAISKTVDSRVVLIALIGKRWLLSSDQKEKRRLENSEDLVRRVIVKALNLNILVIPVLVDGASMPLLTELPDDWKALFRQEPLPFNDTDNDDGFRRLADSIVKVFKEASIKLIDGEKKRRREETQELIQPGFSPDKGDSNHDEGPPFRRADRDSSAGKALPKTVGEGPETLLAVLASGKFPKTAEYRTANTLTRSKRNPVDCTVFAPDRVEGKQSALLQVFLHTPKGRRQAETDAIKFDPETKERGHKSLVLDAPDGTIFAFVVEIEGFKFRERKDTLLWTGKPQSATFRFDVPNNCRWGQHTGTVRILKDGLPVGRIAFEIEVVRDASNARKSPVGIEARHYRACFCSYSTLDRAEMLKRAQGLRATGLETFIDVMTLRPGDIWNPKIFTAIDESDLFVVIWSKNARDSKWVKKESRYALKLCEQRGSPDFVPIPVEGPPIPPVPHGLNARQFNDELLSLIRAAEVEAQERKNKKKPTIKGEEVS